jgi:hypothetical protein
MSRIMHSRGIRSAVALVVGCVSVASVAAEQRPDSEANQWIPAVSVFSGVIGQTSDGTGDSSARGFFEGEAFGLFPYVGLGTELTTPVLGDVAGQPRLFFRGDVALSFDAEQRLVEEGDPGAVKIPVVDPDGPGPQPPREDLPLGAISGLGSATTAEVEPWVFSAGVGIAFSIQVQERSVRVKPSLEYRTERTKYTALISDAESLAGTDVCPCRTAELSAGKRETYHGIGPGLEIEMDAVRTGPIMLTVFISGQAYRILGDRTTHIGVAGTYDDGTPLGAEATATRDAWSYRGGIGLRFRWLPE